MGNPLRILLFENEEDTCRCYEGFFNGMGHLVTAYTDAERLMTDLIETGEGITYDIAIIDRFARDGSRSSGRDIMNQLRKLHPAKPIVCNTSFYDYSAPDADTVAQKPINDTAEFWNRVFEEANEKVKRRQHT